MKRSIASYALPVLVAVALSACGFHLRNNATLPSSLQPIFIGGPQGNSALAQVLRYQLTNSNTEVAKSSSKANYQLLLLKEEQLQRIISLDRRGLAAEYGITSSVTFELRDKQGQRVLGPQTIDERRTITNNPDNALTTSQDVSLVRTDMDQVLASQIVRRLGAFANQPRSATAATPVEPAAAESAPAAP